MELVSTLKQIVKHVLHSIEFEADFSQYPKKLRMVLTTISSNLQKTRSDLSEDWVTKNSVGKVHLTLLKFILLEPELAFPGRTFPGIYSFIAFPARFRG